MDDPYMGKHPYMRFIAAAAVACIERQGLQLCLFLTDSSSRPT